MKNKITLIAVTVLFPLGSFAMSKTTCTMGKNERHVEVASTDATKATPCEVHYVKEDGSDKVLWNAQNDAAFCETKAQEFVQKLGSMGWSCAEASASTGTTATPAK